MNEVQRLSQLLREKAKLVAMLAPSFPIVYDYPKIVGKLKRLGFCCVVEVAAGAEKTNEEIITLLKKEPFSRFIASPCSSFVRLVRNKYPHLKKYLTFSAPSPMAATAQIVQEKYPGFKPVFIGPCITKKLEAAEDYPELKILVLTFKEMDEVFDYFGIKDNQVDKKASFDLVHPQTRLYPLSGGLAESSNLKEILTEEEIEIVSGYQNCLEAIKRFEENPKIRLLDILFCDGGCINGSGIKSPLSLEQRRQKVIDFWKKGNQEKKI